MAQKISTVAADATVPRERVEITRVSIRDKPAPIPEPFVDATVEDMARSVRCSRRRSGAITIEFYPDRAPNHVRQFLRLAAAGVYDGTAFHRVVKGFVIQGGHMPTRKEPPDDRQERYIRTLQPEFTPRRTTAASCRWRAATTRPAPPLRSSSSSRARRRWMAATACSGAWWRGWRWWRRSRRQPVEGEAPVTRVEVLKTRVEP